MAYRLTSRRRVSHQLGHITRQQVHHALQHLEPAAPSEAAIHEARRCVKRARAVLRLLEGAMRPAYRRENDRLRTAAHSLSALRDADANEETLAVLQRRYPKLLNGATGRTIARGLRARKRRTRAQAGTLLRTARVALTQSLKSAPDRVAQAAGGGAVRRGLLRGYRRARNASEEVTMDSGASIFHRLRRRVKDHEDQVRLCEGFASQARSRIRALKQLETWLGDDHNLTLLRRTILAGPSEYGSARATTLVLGCILRYQSLLRTRALRLGARLFRERPAHFQGVVKGWWTQG
jgi:CHAD domain-containing protein